MALPLRAPLHAIVAVVPVSAIQSATIVCEVADKLARWITVKRPAEVVVPGIEDISITQGGSVWWCRGQAVPAGRVVPALGALLGSLLGPAVTRRTPAGLLYVVARATDPRHLAPFDGLTEFRTALARHAARPRAQVVDALLAQFCVAGSDLPQLTSDSSISDVRRLRRASGVALAQIAQDTGIAVSLLRELEWGVYTNWTLQHSRAAVTLYAERAGLDAHRVAEVIEREQAAALVPGEELVAGAASHPAPSRNVPFALAMLLMAALMLAAPGDRAPEPIATKAIAGTLALVPASLAAQGAAHPDTIDPGPQVRPATSPLPRRPRRVAARSRDVVALSRDVAARSRGRTTTPDARHPLVRLARAIAGDGRYIVEPFPKPK
jgi:hypothetical protein